MATVSVIIPVYNAENFLARCLDSLRAQSFSDWEAICVDDGSKDGSAAILDGYGESDPRFRIMHKSNGGVSQARNDALELVSGEFLMFVDSDDFLHPQAMEICVAAALRDKSDLVAFTYDRGFRTRLAIRHFLGLGDPSTFRFRRYCPETVESRFTRDIFDWVTERSDGKVPGGPKRWAIKHCQPWRCLYRSSAVRHIRFIKGIIYEDFPWWSEVLLNIGSATIINLPLYYYYPNQTSYIASAQQQYRIRSLKTAIAAATELYGRKAGKSQLEAWQERFLEPFSEKLEKKIRRFGDAASRTGTSDTGRP